MRTIRIAITGLRQAGKTVFLTSLLNHLLEGSEESLTAFRDEGLTFSARPLPARPEVTRFPYREYLEGLRREQPSWPDRTWEISHFRVGLTLRSLRRHSTREVALEFVDYSGERLLDMPLLSKDYATWSDEVVREAGLGSRKDLSGPWLAAARDVRPGTAGDDASAGAAVEAYRGYVTECREHGLAFVQPSAMLLPDGEPVQFCPLPADVRQFAPVLAGVFRSRYGDYVRHHVRPFFRASARCSRQIVLVDVLGVLRRGVHCYNDVRRSLRQILDAYVYAVARPRFSPLRLADMLRARIGRVAFVATKADQCTRATRGNLRMLLEDLIDPKRRHLIATLPHGRPRVMFCAANRSTEDACKEFEGRELSCLRGVREGDSDGRDGPWFPGEVPPEWPQDDWDPELEQFRFPDFLPGRLPMRDGAVVPHINLDKVFHFVIEDLIR